MKSRRISHYWPVSTVSSIAMMSVLSVAQAASIDSWNRDNVVTDLPPHAAGVTYDSKLYTNSDRLESNGTLIWKEGSVVSPGAQVLTNSPESPDGSGPNCIITTGTDRSDPTSPPKTCSDAFQSAKRVKLEARDSDTPLDMVFNASDADGQARTYRVFKKYINAIGQRMDGFVVELGFGTGDNFVSSSDGDGLKFAKRQRGNNTNIRDFDPLPYFSIPPGDSDLGSLMSAGLFGDAADNQNRNIDGYFGLPADVAPWTDPTCDPDPSTTGRAYYDLVVQTEDRIETVGNVQGLHYCLFGNMLPQGELPLGFFWDGDGDPVTDADTIADWDGSGDSPACGGTPCWETYVALDTDSTSPTYGDPILDASGNFTRPANPPIAVPQDLINFWVANTEDAVIPGEQFYFITELDDMGLVNNNYNIAVESVDTWPTYDATTGTATFTMRTTNIGEGVAFDAPWLAALPPEMEADPLPSNVAVTLAVAGTVDEGTEVPIDVSVTTAANQDAASGHVVGEAVDPDSGKAVASFYGEFSDLAAGASQAFTFNWLVADPTGLPAKVEWTVTAHVDGGDPEMGDNTAIAEVVINAAPTPVDVSIDEFEVPRNAKSGETEEIKVTVFVSEDSTEPASGSVTVTANGETVFIDTFSNLRAGQAREMVFDWTAPSVTSRETVNWLAIVTAVGDSDLTNNSATGTTRVVPRR